MAAVQRWTGREARALRIALRFSVRAFAEHLGISARSVSKWEAGGASTVPRPDAQAMLDTVLGQADHASQQRFEMLCRSDVGSTVGPAVLESTVSKSFPAIPALRAVLMDYRQSFPSLASSALPDEPPDLDVIERDVADLFDGYQASRYCYVTDFAPLVVADALNSVRNAKPRDEARAHALLALAYQATASVLTKLGESDLAWIASERGLAAAQKADNPVVLGSLFRSVAHALLSTGRYAAGVELVSAAVGVLEPQLDGGTNDAMLSVYGTLFLTGAVSASRAADRDAAISFLDEAAVAASQLGRDANAMWTAFGPTNVAIHRMTSAMEFGDVQAAVDLVPRIDASALPVERQVRHAMETARAYAASNRRDDALAALLDAEQLAPEQVRHHSLSRQMVFGWLRSSRGPHGVLLEQLGHRMRPV